MKDEKFPIPATIEVSLGDDDLEESLLHQKGLWLGRYTPEELFAQMEQFGIERHLSERGYTHLEPHLVCEPFRYHLRIEGSAGPDDKPDLLIEVKARRTTENVIGRSRQGPYSSLVLDWVLFQDPRAEFAPEHPRLPGQKHPGLQLLDMGTRLLLAQVKELNVDLVLTYPGHFHNAVFYSPQFRFLEAAAEGHFQALVRDLMGDERLLAEASEALDNGQVLDGSGRPVFWIQKAQAWALRKSVEDDIFTPDYLTRVESASQQRFTYA